MGFKSGFVGVLGQTNVGKSTLVNALLGAKRVIVSDKPQTTRNRIRCILNRDDAQLVFVDTPGLHKPADRLSDYLTRQAYGALEGLDLVLYLVEPWGAPRAHDRGVFERLKRIDAPRFLVVNKIDRAGKADVLRTLEAHAKLDLFDEYVPISAATGANLDRLFELAVARLPEGAPYFPTDQTVDKPLEFLIGELIREQVFALTRQEVPYATAVEVIHLEERADKPLIEVTAAIDVARKSQRGILIGQSGAMIKRIGQRAREEVESLLGTQVYLDLQVRVRARWNQDPTQIKRLLGRDA